MFGETSSLVLMYNQALAASSFSTHSQPPVVSSSGLFSTVSPLQGLLLLFSLQVSPGEGSQGPPAFLMAQVKKRQWGCVGLASRVCVGWLSIGSRESCLAQRHFISSWAGAPVCLAHQLCPLRRDFWSTGLEHGREMPLIVPESWCSLILF